MSLLDRLQDVEEGPSAGRWSSLYRPIFPLRLQAIRDLDDCPSPSRTAFTGRGSHSFLRGQGLASSSLQLRAA